MIKISTTSKIYADVLLKLGRDEILSYEIIISDLEKIRQICISSPELTKTLNNPTILTEIKLQIIEEVFAKDINCKIIDFLKILTEKNRFNELEEIIAAFQNILDEINNVKRIDIITAIALNDEKKSIIVAKLQNKLKKNIIPTWITDKSIIAGLVIKIDDNIIDTSVKNKLENLSKTLI